MTTHRNAGLRRAAILIESLDRKLSRKLLRQLNHVTVEQIVETAKTLNDVSSREKELVLTDFLCAIQVIPRERNELSQHFQDEQEEVQFT